MGSDGFHPPLEEYLEAIHELVEEGVPVIQARLAERVGHAAPTVSDMIRKLRTEGYITVDGRTIEMTELGHKYAESVVRKHRLAERLLTDVIGLSWSKSHNEACRWEHVISDEVEERLMVLLGNPETCPHGNPIPGSYKSTTKLRTLESVPTGDTVKIERITEQIEINDVALRYIDHNDLRPGAVVTVSSRSNTGALVLKTSTGDSVDLDQEISQSVFVSAISA